MAQVAENVRVGGDGVIWTAPAATPAPTAPALTGGKLALLATPWVDLGYASDDGVKKSTSVDSEDIKAWQRADVVRTSVTSAETEYALTLIEQNKPVIELVFETTVGDDGSWVENPGRSRNPRSFVLDVIDGDRAQRIYIPSGVVSSELEDEEYANGSPIGYGIKIKTRYSDAIGGHAKRWWTHLKKA